MKKHIISAVLMAASFQIAADELVSPASMSDEAQIKMFEQVTEYNRCMMQGRLQTSQTGQDAQATAEAILQSCENHLDTLKLHLTENNVDAGLAEGMTKKLRSRAARQLMTRTMNNMAAQAAAMENAQKMQIETAQ